jgi:hypothetical protein
MTHEEQELAARAREIVNDPVLRVAFERLQAGIDQARRNTNYDDHKQREHLFVKETLLAEFKRELETVIIRGEIEEAPKTYVERLREHVKKSWF